MALKKEKNIYRIDSDKKNHGWLVEVKYADPEKKAKGLKSGQAISAMRRWFTDAKYGSKTKSMEAAVKERERMRKAVRKIKLEEARAERRAARAGE